MVYYSFLLRNMQQEIQLLAESVVKLILKNRDTRYVSAIALDGDKLRIDYSNGYNQKIEVPKITKETIITADNTDSRIEEIKNDIQKEIAQLSKENVRFSTKTHKKYLTELNKAKEELGCEINKRLDSEIQQTVAKYFNIAADDKKELLALFTELESKLVALIDKAVSNIEVKDGTDGKDADEEKIIKELSLILKEEIAKELQKGLEEIKSSIPKVKDGVDGRDADEEAIFLRLERKLELALLNIKVRDGKDGRDGRDANEEEIKASLKEALLLVIDNYKTEITFKLDEELERKEAELKTAILDIIKEQIALIPKAQDGRDGIDGQDADEELIKEQVLTEINLLISQKLITTESNLKELIFDLVSQIKAPKGDKGDPGESIKGEPGESIKGDKGNGIKSAEIDPMGELIIHTDEKKIRAGKVGITNIFGGSGGGTIKYTNTAPTPFALGGIEKGTRFKDVDLRTLFTKLMYGWEFPEFTAFSIKLSGVALENQLEIGATITGGTYTADWTIANTELLAENSIVIEQDSVVLLENLSNNSPIDLTLDDITRTEPSTINFTISAYDTTGVSFAKHLSVSFMYRIYYGEGVENIILKDPVTLEDYPNPLMAFRETKLVNTIIGTEYHFPEAPNIPDALPYKWLCCPKAFGELGTHYIFCDLITDIAMVFADKEEITITNEYDLEIPYYCYRTENKIFGEFIMKVKNG